jgi:hypothetical protein
MRVALAKAWVLARVAAQTLGGGAVRLLVRVATWTGRRMAAEVLARLGACARVLSIMAVRVRARAAVQAVARVAALALSIMAVRVLARMEMGALAAQALVRAAAQAATGAWARMEMGIRAGMAALSLERARVLVKVAARTAAWALAATVD